MAKRLTDAERAARQAVKEERARIRAETKAVRVAEEQEKERLRLLKKRGLYCPNVSCSTHLQSDNSPISSETWRQAEATNGTYECPTCQTPLCTTLPTGYQMWFGAVTPTLSMKSASEYRIYECEVCFRPSIFPKHLRCAVGVAAEGDHFLSRLFPYHVAGGIPLDEMPRGTEDEEG